VIFKSIVAGDAQAGWRSLLLGVFAMGALARPISAQCRDSTVGAPSAFPRLAALTFIGGDVDSRVRVSQELGRCPAAGWLMRTTTLESDSLSTHPTGWRWVLIAPAVDATWNQRIPFSMNDGAMWAGRGLATMATVGVHAERDRFSLTLAPQILYQQNQAFFVLANTTPGRSAYSSPWHGGRESADLPLRFGNQPTRQLVPGESQIEARLGDFGLGASTQSQWWGPGMRNALVMSDNAAGIPRLYARTLHPIDTRIGRVEGTWMIGGLTESLYFDRDPSNDARSISAFVLTLSPSVDTGLTVGLARSVYAAVSSNAAVPAHALDVLTRWNQRDDTLATGDQNGTDQIMSLFGRWLFPANGLEIYGEWAKLFPPRGLRELLVQPQHGQGFTVGMQVATPVRTSATFALQLEATMLEQTPRTRAGSVASFYTSRYVPQGYTQRGQSIGAAIGPGSSSQWIAGDYLAKSKRLGLYLGRIRWEDEAYYRSPAGIGTSAHDVSIFLGLRGGGTVANTDVMLDITRMLRMAYLFQNAESGYGPDPAFDVRQFSIRMSIVPSAHGR
jgi:hypothetical protein